MFIINGEENSNYKKTTIKMDFINDETTTLLQKNSLGKNY